MLRAYNENKTTKICFQGLITNPQKNSQYTVCTVSQHSFRLAAPVHFSYLIPEVKNDEWSNDKFFQEHDSQIHSTLGQPVVTLEWCAWNIKHQLPHIEFIHAAIQGTFYNLKNSKSLLLILSCCKLKFMFSKITDCACTDQHSLASIPIHCTCSHIAALIDKFIPYSPDLRGVHLQQCTMSTTSFSKMKMSNSPTVESSRKLTRYLQV